jgi:prepilin-type N-terminal cleavage/methylation domain-containing protein
MAKGREGGFTLIELSIVLVIIGLLVGGVLVGQDLIKAAEVRAQITQIEKFNTAANTFYGKYGYLPGDIPPEAAAQFGFVTREGNCAGHGDGNGLVEGILDNNCGTGMGIYVFGGETALFWCDLSSTHLIDGSFNTATDTSDPEPITPSQVSLYMPSAKISNNYVYVWSGGWSEWWIASSAFKGDQKNYFGISAVSGDKYGNTISGMGLTVSQAYGIDEKVDDGLPQSGAVLAIYDGEENVWASGGSLDANGETVGGANDGVSGGPSTAATPGSATTCYDNGNVAGVQQAYSLAQNNGAGVNCALSFRMQAGD